MHNMVINLNSKGISSFTCSCGIDYKSTFGYDIDRVVRRHSRENPESIIATYVDGQEFSSETKRAHPFRRTNNGIEL